MAKKRERVIDIRDFYIEDLNTYEIITLYSLKKHVVHDHPILLIKAGGMWPILIANSLASHYISEKDITVAVENTRIEIERKRPSIYIDPPWPKYTFAVFLEHLLGNEWNRTSLRGKVEEITREYIATIGSLEQKNLIKDPPAGENWRIIGDTFEELDNILSEEGKEKINKLEPRLAGFKDEFKLPADVVQLYRKFLEEVIASSVG